MKQLNWLSKILPFTNRILSSRKHIFGLGAAFIITIAAFSCQIHRRQYTKDHNNSSDWGAFNLLSDSPSRDFSVSFRDPNTNQTTDLMRLTINNCEQPNLNIHYQMDLYSAFGRDLIEFQLNHASEKKVINLTVNQKPMSVAHDPTVFFKLNVLICEQDDDLKSFTTQDPQIYKSVKALMSKIVPDCEFTNQDNRITCKLKKIEPSLAEKDLFDIKRTMIRRWSRQPYLISRRLSMALQLARALQSSEVDDELDALCRVIKYSDPLEPPLAMSTKRWQEAVCPQIVPNRYDVAHVGLTKAFAEIEFLRQLFEQTSKLGILSVKIPRSSTPTRDLWVSLEPKDDVAEHIIAESRELTDSATSDSNNHPLPTTCWHPLFQDDSRNLHIAQQLDLFEIAQNATCVRSVAPAINAFAERYLADSITSETEFVISNGRGKILRLPAGTYTYKIKPHSDTMGWEEVPKESTQGEIKWASRRPNALISKW